MRFADPHACPSCGGAIAGQDRCPHCQFVLSSAVSLQLWQTLLAADSLLERARAESVATPVATAVAAASPLGTPAPMPVPRREKPVGRTWSTGSIILGLGALCLLVAAFVFITVSWSVLGETGRTVVLLAITSAVAAGAVLVTRKGLRASAEALWAIFFGLFSIDYFAAHAYGLFGFDAVDQDPVMFAYGLVMAVGGAAVALALRTFLPLIVPSLAAGLGVWMAAFWLTAMVDLNFFWSVFCGLVLVVVAAGLAWLLSLRLLAVIAGVAVVCYYAFAAGGAIEELASSAALGEIAGEGHGVPMVVMIALTVVIGLFKRPLAMPAATLATLGTASLVFAPSVDASDNAGFIAGALLVAIPAVALIRGSGDWIRGARIATLAMLAALAIAALAWVANAAEAIADSSEDEFARSWSPRLVNTDGLPGPGWLALIVFAAIAVAVFAALRWPEAGFAASLEPMPLFIAATGLAVGIVAYEPPVLLAALLVLALGAGLLAFVRVAVHDGLTRDIWLGVALVVIALPTVMALASEPGALVVWLAVALVLVGVPFVFRRVWIAMATTAGATALLIGSSAVAADLAGFDDVWICLTAIVVGLLALAAASSVLRAFSGRLAVEATAAVGLAVVLAAATDLSIASQAFLWTVVGGVLVVLGLFVHDRHVVRYVGAGALGVAWVMRLAASNVETVEAYTAPFAVVLLGAGLLAMRDNPRLRTSIALTPGLTLAFLPSLPQALDEPTSLRALLLGVAGLVALGIGLWRRWQMPFLFGTAAVTLIVLWNVGPLAAGLPRWILIAAAGIVLVGSGITWENRVRNARTATEFVQNLK